MTRERRVVETPTALVADWPLAVVLALSMLALLAVIGGLIGLGAGLAANGFENAGLAGGLAGLWAPFAMLGGDTAVVVGSSGGGVIWTSATVWLAPLLLVFVIARSLTRRAMRHRVSPLISLRVAFAAKFAVAFAAAVGAAAAALSFGDADGVGETPRFRTAAQIGIAEPVLWALVVVLVAALTVALEHRTRDGRDRAEQPLMAANAGIAALLILVFALGSLATVGAVAMADGRQERIAASFLSPLTIANAGVISTSVALGASVELVNEFGSGDIWDTAAADPDTHVSLAQFGIPPADGDPAPIWLWISIAAAPATVAACTWRWLRRHQLHSGNAILGASLASGLAFAIGALALGAAVRLVGAGITFDNNDAPIFRFVVARPAMASTFGLAFVAGSVGALAAGVAAARARGVSLLAASSSAAVKAYCPNCGNSLRDRIAFCPHCGTSLGEGSAPFEGHSI